MRAFRNGPAALEEQARCREPFEVRSACPAAAMDMWHADVNAVTADLCAATVAFNPIQLPSTLPRCVFF